MGIFEFDAWICLAGYELIETAATNNARWKGHLDDGFQLNPRSNEFKVIDLFAHYPAVFREFVDLSFERDAVLNFANHYGSLSDAAIRWRDASIESPESLCNWYDTIEQHRKIFDAISESKSIDQTQKIELGMLFVDLEWSKGARGERSRIVQRVGNLRHAMLILI